MHNNNISSNIPSEVLAIWEKTIDVQQHFNNIELTIRNYTLTLFTAILAGIAYLLKEKFPIEFIGYLIPASALGALFGVIIMCVFYFMDKYWYHNLLIGAVRHAISIESQFIASNPEIGLSTTIGKFSPVNFFGHQFHSNKKYYFFYYPLILIFVILYFILLVWG